ncbi:MAG: peptidylprolyl isomerase [Faecousia sp.]
MKKLIAILLSLTMVLCLFAGCKAEEKQPENTQGGNTVDITGGGKHHVEIEVENYGTITVELDADAAPITVANFLKLAQEGFYNGLTFHRIMKGFMMQGGDPEGTGFGGSDETIKGEFSANGVDNPLSHTRGAISMARNGYDMDSASSQFFIVHQDSTFLDGDYACFGYVTSGMEVVDAICKDAKPTDDNGTIPAAQQPVITEIRVID